MLRLAKLTEVGRIIGACRAKAAKDWQYYCWIELHLLQTALVAGWFELKCCHVECRWQSLHNGEQRRDLTPPFTTAWWKVFLRPPVCRHQLFTPETWKLHPRTSYLHRKHVDETNVVMICVPLPICFCSISLMLLYNKRGFQTPCLILLSWILILHDSAKFANWSDATTKGSWQKQPGLANIFFWPDTCHLCICVPFPLTKWLTENPFRCWCNIRALPRHK